MSLSVSAIMTTEVITAPPTVPVRKALRLLEDLELRHLPVVDGDALVGILSDRDLREFRMDAIKELVEGGAFESGRSLDTPISEVMSGLVISVDTEESVRAAIDTMLEYGVGAVPVVDRATGHLEGIVSYVDILRALREDLDDDDDD